MAPPRTFVFLIDCAGIVAQDAPRRGIEIVRTVRVSDRNAFAELGPARSARDGLHMAMSIDVRRRRRSAGRRCRCN